MMVADHPLSASVACLVLTAILSLPHVGQLIPRSSDRQYYLLSGSPEDNDDNANQIEGKSPASLAQRIVLAVAAGVGTLAAFLSLLDDDSVEASWRIASVLQFVTWVRRSIYSLLMRRWLTRAESTFQSRIDSYHPFPMSRPIRARLL